MLASTAFSVAALLTYISLCYHTERLQRLSDATEFAPIHTLFICTFHKLDAIVITVILYKGYSNIQTFSKPHTVVGLFRPKTNPLFELVCIQQFHACAIGN